MQAPPPAKIKSFLGTIKAEILENEEASNNAETTFLALLKMELLLRGVIAEDDSKLWQEVLSNIGKALLNDTLIPKPLLAGATVMAGRVAEACFQNRQSFQPNKSAASAALKRAKEIKDERFITLLEQDFDPMQVAKGYFTRSALIQSDTPMFWKKLWDVIEAQNDEESENEGGTPFEAQVAIENLIRIADAKGNTKRSNELRLKLIQSYLNEAQGNSANQTSKLFADSTSSSGALPTDPKVLAELAQDALEKCIKNELTDDADQIMYQILQLRVKIAQEEATIEQLAQEQYQNNKNRSVSSSMDKVRSQCRKKVFSQPGNDVHKVSLELRDTLLDIWNIDSSCLSLCFKWTQKAFVRLRNRALLLPTGDDNIAWNEVLEYILPILDAIKAKCNWNLESSTRKHRIEAIVTWMQRENTTKYQRGLISSVVTNFPNLYWMVLGVNHTVGPMNELFYLILDIIPVLQNQSVATKEKSSAAVGSKNNVSSESQEWEYAKSMAMCFVCQDDSDVIYQITRGALSKKKDKIAKGPLGVLQCLVCWSGWFQRPWIYCSNISDARRLVAAARIDPGRQLTELEQSLLDLAEADAELLDGGFQKVAWELYLKVSNRVQELNYLDDGTRALLQAHCTNGLAHVLQFGVEIDRQRSVEDYGQETLGTLDGVPPVSNLLMWHASNVLSASVPHQLSVARQTIADSLINKNRCEEARVFLEAAVNDSPFDADAAFALGAFLLRIAFFVNQERAEETDKIAQIQLLKAAKLDPSKANPFALLGYWFEVRGDLGRAKGCYTKSLSLDPCNPVAGRGLLRVENFESVKGFLDNAIDKNSPVNGWAWYAIGLNKVLVQGEDDFAIVALLKALRCRDVTKHANETLGIFYHVQSGKLVNERATVLEETGQCYRRLGRFTAAIRAFHAAIEAFGDTIPSSVLCSCAQVELDLALFEDAAEKFGEVLQKKEETSARQIAAYGQGIALLSIAQRDFQDGKAGAALKSIKRAVSSCEEFGGNNFACIQKLLGDLYSFAAVLPPTVFNSSSEFDKVNLSECTEEKVKYVAFGEDAYRSALAANKGGETDGQAVVQASYLCDVATNILLQAQTMSNFYTDNSNNTEVDLRYEKAAREFENAIGLNPIHAPSWCGLGCAVVSKDPLLAQHAFCRCLQIERMLPDGYANVGFLYTTLQAFDASEETMNALTQVADTPMMWINRAFMLEQKAMADLKDDSSKSSQRVRQAADAYRAALQVLKQPDAMIGLAVTNRVISDGKEMKDTLSNSLDYGIKRKESLVLMTEFLEASPHFREAASMLCGVMSLEQATMHKRFGWSDEILERGQIMAKTALAQKKQILSSLDIESVEKCLTNVSDSLGKEKSGSSLSLDSFIQKKILIEPSRPDLWLALAKELVACLDQSSPFYKIDSAFQAAKRALDMLSETLTYPHRIDGQIASFVSSEMVSESLGLVHCLEDLKETDTVAVDASFDLQRSLMMCPNNILSREALGLA